MSEIKHIKKAVDKNKDWAVLPFDEEEDDKRWGLLLEETEQLEKDIAQFEATHGEKILMNEPLSEVQAEEQNEVLGDLF